MATKTKKATAAAKTTAAKKAPARKPAAKALPKAKEMLGYPSWKIANDDVEVYLAERGGHMGPVTFFRGKENFSPLSVAPWYKEKNAKYDDKLLSLLRGDFFAMPFGGNAEPYGKEKYHGHGETANENWKLVEMGVTEEDCECGCGGGTTYMAAEIKTKIRKATVEKLIAIREGEQAIYICHDISDMTGPMCYGHHAMLKWEKQGAGLISTSKFKFGQVYPGMFENPELGGYSSLKPGATFTSLTKVPMANGGYADLSIYPARLGFEDLVMICADTNIPFAWSAAVYPEQRMVWFALKDPKKLASTILWHSNRGRYYAPWNGRHQGVLGIEEVTAYFATGLAGSVKPNPVSRKGIPTSRTFKASETFSIPYIMAAAKVPAGFDHVKSIDPISDDKVRLTAKNGKKAECKVAWEFLNYDDEDE